MSILIRKYSFNFIDAIIYNDDGIAKWHFTSFYGSLTVCGRGKA